MRLLKVYFLVVLSLFVFSLFNLARAENETVAAVSKTTITGWSQNGGYSSVCSAAAQSLISSLVGRAFASVSELTAEVTAFTCEHGAELVSVNLTANGGRVLWKRPSTSYYMDFQLTGASSLACPDSTYTLSGTFCVRPSCPAGATRQLDGSCSCPSGYTLSQLTNTCVEVCSQYQGVESFEGLMADPSKFQPFCDSSGCAWVFSRSSETPTGYTGGGLSLPAYDVYARGAGVCGEGDNVSVTAQKEEALANDSQPAKPNPDCAENVITTSSGEVVCVPESVPNSRKPEIVRNKKSEVDQAGNIKETEKIQIIDPKTGASNTVTVESDSTGQKTTTETETRQGGSGSGSGSGSGDGDCSGDDCTEGGNDPLGPAGSFGDASGEIEEAKGRLISEFNAIKSEASELFSPSSVGGGSLPCPPPVTVLGVPFSICLSDYSDQLGVIALAVMAMAYISAAFILLRGK